MSEGYSVVFWFERVLKVSFIYLGQVGLCFFKGVYGIQSRIRGYESSFFFILQDFCFYFF